MHFWHCSLHRCIYPFHLAYCYPGSSSAHLAWMRVHISGTDANLWYSPFRGHTQRQENPLSDMANLCANILLGYHLLCHFGTRHLCAVQSWLWLLCIHHRGKKISRLIQEWLNEKQLKLCDFYLASIYTLHWSEQSHQTVNCDIHRHFPQHNLLRLLFQICDSFMERKIGRKCANFTYWPS